jgi:branched-chain amino acid transport system permease protein
MLKTLSAHVLSDDLPRSRVLSVMLLLVAAYVLAAPFLFPGARSLNVSVTICVFLVLVGSFDLLLGYSGMVSFAHAMFYGIGAYGVGIALHKIGPSWSSVFIGAGGALGLSAVLAVLMALISLRVKAIFYTMTTLAVAAAFGALVLRMTSITGGDDGRNFRLPEALSPGFELLEEPVFGTMINGKLLAYYLVLVVSLLLFVLMLRIVNSRFGRVLEAIRENEFRAEAIGYRTLYYRLVISVVAALIAAAAGMLMALWLRYVGPQTTVGFNVMLNILLMAVIGGLGTIYGAVIGVVVFTVAENYLQLLLQKGASIFVGIPVVEHLLHPDRWLLWFGVVFVLAVYFFPTGVVGKLRERAGRAARSAGKSA